MRRLAILIALPMASCVAKPVQVEFATKSDMIFHIKCDAGEDVELLVRGDEMASFDMNLLRGCEVSSIGPVHFHGRVSK